MVSTDNMEKEGGQLRGPTAEGKPYHFIVPDSCSLLPFPQRDMYPPVDWPPEGGDNWGKMLRK